MEKTGFSKVDLKKIRKSIVEEHKKRDCHIFGGSDADKLESLINFAILNHFGVDLFDNDD